MSRGSKKPCPGCGKVQPWRAAKDVCSDCRRLLRKAAWLEEKLSELNDDEVVVAFAIRAHWNEYIYTRSGTGGNLQDIFQRIAEAGFRPTALTDKEFDLLGETDSGAERKYTVAPRPLAEAVRDLRIAVGEALELEYKQGKKDGHNLLMRMATGDLSMSDFSKETED